MLRYCTEIDLQSCKCDGSCNALVVPDNIVYESALLKKSNVSSRKVRMQIQQHRLYEQIIVAIAQTMLPTPRIILEVTPSCRRSRKLNSVHVSTHFLARDQCPQLQNWYHIQRQKTGGEGATMHRQEWVVYYSYILKEIILFWYGGRCTGGRGKLLGGEVEGEIGWSRGVRTNIFSRQSRSCILKRILLRSLPNLDFAQVLTTANQGSKKS